MKKEKKKFLASPIIRATGRIMDSGQLFAHWSTANSVRGTDDPKPEALPAVIHLPRPPWH